MRYYIYIVYFDICTALFQQFLVVLKKKCFKQLRQVYLLTALKKHCYISILHWYANHIRLAVNETRMSIKGKGVDVNDMEVPNKGPSLRISMANLSLRDDFQNGDHFSRHHPDLM